METWQDRLRATLARNIAGLRRLDKTAAAALLEAEFAAVMEATEAGLPFGAEATPPQAADTEPDIEDVIEAAPPPKRKALAKK